VSSVRFTPLAEADLVGIVDFIAEEAGPDRANRVLSDILRAVDRLADRPGVGHARADLTDEKVLFWSVQGFLIIYRRHHLPSTKAHRNRARDERTARHRDTASARVFRWMSLLVTPHLWASP
jgi:plasmid stabilization system protein ParE